MIKTSILLIILASALVTWVPRVLPFLLTQNKSLPPKLV
ncbi:TPA: AzlD domain-containing protein, partial [Streptococcus suis]